MLAVRAGFSMRWIEWDGIEGEDENAGHIRVDGRIVPVQFTQCDIAETAPHCPGHMNCVNAMGTPGGFTFAFKLPNGLVAACVADDRDAPLFLWNNMNEMESVYVTNGRASMTEGSPKAMSGSFETYDDLMNLIDEWSKLVVA